MPSRTMKPALDSVSVFSNCGLDRHFGRSLIGISRISRNRFSLQALAQLSITLPNMALQRVATVRFIARQVVALAGLKRHMLDGLGDRSGSFVSGTKNNDKCKKDQDSHRPEHLLFSFHLDILPVCSSGFNSEPEPSCLLPDLIKLDGEICIYDECGAHF